MGTMANELTLGCDCLGKIHYMVLLDVSQSDLCPDRNHRTELIRRTTVPL